MHANFAPDLNETILLPAVDSWPDAFHRFDAESVLAVQTALAIGRPLLLRGEPGIGKSQLARAVAAILKSPFLYHVMDERSERDDLLHFNDAVARLAEAQVCAHLAKANEDWREVLSERNFMRPGVLWWAFDWESAKVQAARFRADGRRVCKEPVAPAGWTPEAAQACGPVVLIDEIDKADPSVPNGLLECLGNKGFQIAQIGEGVELPEGNKPPLIMITTNEERELPSAFLRRCLVLHLEFPSTLEAGIEFLWLRGKRLAKKLGLEKDLCCVVAECICRDREEARGRMALPGAAEYLDLLRALADVPNEMRKDRLDQIKKFVLQKHDSPA